MRSPLSLLFSLNKPNSLRLSSQKRCPLIIFGLFLVCPWLSCTGRLKTAHSTEGVASPVLSRRKESPPLTCWWYYVHVSVVLEDTEGARGWGHRCCLWLYECHFLFIFFYLFCMANSAAVNRPQQVITGEAFINCERIGDCNISQLLDRFSA